MVSWWKDTLSTVTSLPVLSKSCVVVTLISSRDVSQFKEVCVSGKFLCLVFVHVRDLQHAALADPKGVSQ